MRTLSRTLAADPRETPMRTPARIALCGLMIAALTSTAACTKTATTTTQGGLSAASGPATAPAASGTGGGTSPSPTGTTATSATTPAAATTKPVATGPRIVDFSVKQKPACPIVPTSDAPFAKDPVNIVLQWTVTGATQVALSLDEPGFFKKYHTGSLDEYPTKQTLELAFNCDPTVQPNTTHVYTLDTIGGGASQEKTLTVTVQTSP